MTESEDELIAIATAALASGAAAFQPVEPRAELWDRIERGVREERLGHGPQTALRILLSCTFCKGGLDRKEALYCAACLAPYHQDCLDTHGRCAAMGCGETRLVAPREARSRRSRRLAPLLALLVGAPLAAVAAYSARGKTAASPPDLEAALAAVGEPEHGPGRWPWSAPSPPAGDEEVTKRLATQRLTFNFADTPFDDVLQFLHDFTNLEMRPDGIDLEKLEVNLRLRDVTALNALDIIANVARLVWVPEKGGIRFVPRDRIASFREHDRHTDALAVLGEAEDDNATVFRRLHAQRINLNFDATPVRDALDTLHELTSIDFVVTREAVEKIDATAAVVALKVRDVVVRDALTRILVPHGLESEIRNGVVFIRPAVSRPTVPALVTRRVRLEGRGLTVADLVRSLQSQGVDTYTMRSTWASSGTFSLAIAAETPLPDALAVVASATALRPRIVTLDSQREVVILDGRVAGAHHALTAELPPFTGVVAEVNELRARLAQDLLAREAARRDAGIPVAELYARERAVELDASTILSLIGRADAVIHAPETHDLATRQLERLAGPYDDVREKKRRTRIEYEQTVAALESSRAVREVELGEQQWTLDREAKAAVAKAKRLKTREAEDEAIKAGRLYESVRRDAMDEKDALDKKITATKREYEIRLVKIEREIDTYEARLNELRRMQILAGRDWGLRESLERGLRMAEAER